MKKALAAISDENYIVYASYLFKKVRSFGIHEPLFLLTDNVSPENYLKHFGEIENCFHLQCESQIDLLKVSSTRHVTRATYIKLLMPELIPTDIDRVLYLDVDVFLNKNIRPILDFPLREIIAGTQFANGETESLHGHSNHSYFSAGVLLIDVNRWKKDDAGKRCLHILSSNPNSFRYQDMDVLNLAFLENWQVLPPSFNFMNQPELNYVARTTQIDPILVHFPGPLKPWTKRATSKMARNWREDFISMGFRIDKNNADKPFIRTFLALIDTAHFKSALRVLLGRTSYEKLKKWLTKN